MNPLLLLGAAAAGVAVVMASSSSSTTVSKTPIYSIMRKEVESFGVKGGAADNLASFIYAVTFSEDNQNPDVEVTVFDKLSKELGKKAAEDAVKLLAVSAGTTIIQIARNLKAASQASSVNYFNVAYFIYDSNSKNGLLLAPTPEDFMVKIHKFAKARYGAFDLNTEVPEGKGVGQRPMLARVRTRLQTRSPLLNRKYNKVFSRT